jgi:hypothetical protein
MQTTNQPKKTDAVKGGTNCTKANNINTSAVLGSPHRPAATEQLPLLPKVITIEKMTGQEKILEDGSILLDYKVEDLLGKIVYQVRGYAVLVNGKIAKGWRGNFEVYSLKSTAKIVAESIAIAPSFPGRNSQEQEIMRSLMGAIVNEFRVKLYPSSMLLDAANELVKFGWLNTQLEPSRVNNLTNQSSSLRQYEFALTNAGKKALAACEEYYS